MQLHTINSIHAYALIVLSLYRYHSSINPQPAVLLPIFLAVVLLVCNSGVEYGHRPMTITAFITTLVVAAIFVYQVSSSTLGWNDQSLIPIYLLIIASITSAAFYIRSFLAK